MHRCINVRFFTLQMPAIKYSQYRSWFTIHFSLVICLILILYLVSECIFHIDEKKTKRKKQAFLYLHCKDAFPSPFHTAYFGSRLLCTVLITRVDSLLPPYLDSRVFAKIIWNSLHKTFVSSVLYLFTHLVL